jgi:hypothetical protein
MEMVDKTSKKIKGKVTFEDFYKIITGKNLGNPDFFKT